MDFAVSLRFVNGFVTIDAYHNAVDHAGKDAGGDECDASVPIPLGQLVGGAVNIQHASDDAANGQGCNTAAVKPSCAGSRGDFMGSRLMTKAGSVPPSRGKAKAKTMKGEYTPKLKYS